VPPQLPAFGAAPSGSPRPVQALIAVNVVVAIVTLVMIVAADGFSPGAILFDGISPLPPPDPGRKIAS
jgi:hypothetical protein